MAEPLYLDPETIATRLGVTRGRVLDWIRRGLLPAIRIPSKGLHGYTLRVAEADFERFVAERRTVA